VGLYFRLIFKKQKFIVWTLTFKLNRLIFKSSYKIKIDQLDKDGLERFIYQYKLKNKIDLISVDGAH